MGWLIVVGTGFGALLFHAAGYPWLLVAQVTSGVVAWWSYGVMHNYAMEAAKGRAGFTGRFYDITEREADSVPNWLALLNMLASVVALVLLIAAMVISVTR